MLAMRTWRSVLLAALAGGLVACGGTKVIPRAQAPGAPTQGLTKCSVAASRSNPLVTEWPASEKANLEVRLREGAVAVAYTGCDMQLVPECRIGGGYQWLRTTSATDVIEIHNETEASQVMVRPHGKSMGLFATGVTFTALGGVAVGVGIPLTAVGFATGNDGLRNAGLISGGVGLGVMVPSIVMVVAGGSYIEITEQGGLEVGPGQLRGTF